jgi:hypothetical protein
MTKKKSVTKFEDSVQVQAPTSSKSSKKSEETFYIGITQSSLKRKLILELTADYLRLLKHIELHKAKRAEKKTTIEAFHKIMQDIRTQTQNLYNQLPKHNIPHKVLPSDTKKNGNAKPAPVEVPKPRQKSELELLESELASIEKKLQVLQ